MSSGGSTPPARIQWEIDRFHQIDLRVDVSQDEHGRWVFSFKRRYRGKEHPFRAVLPIDFPEMEPAVYGPPGLLERHQDPITGNLCLTDNDVNWWTPARSLVELVGQLEALLSTSADGRNAVVALEAPMAEPITGYLPYRDDRTILVPDAMLADVLGAGSGTFRLRRINQHLHVMAQLSDAARNPIARAEGPIVELTRDDAEVGGWIELGETPSVAGLVETLTEASGRALDRRETWRGKSKKGYRATKQHPSRVTGVTFFEEGPGQGERRRTWVFAETRRVAGGAVWVRDAAIRTQAIGEAQRAQRTPELDGLAAARIVMIGAGSLGSHVAIELAKGGVGRLEIFDADVYEPGNSVRHVLPVTFAGRNKAEAVAEFCKQLNPFCAARGNPDHVGRPHGDPPFVHEVTENADLLIETTGSHEITRMLYRRASFTGVPILTAALSRGGHGGRVVALRAGGPCWDCFLYAQEAGRVRIPDEGPRHDATPYGCSHPAASCAGFDVVQVAAVAARMAVQTLLCTPYPALDHDWVVMNFRPGSEAVACGALYRDADCPVDHGDDPAVAGN